jgi:putative transposase
MFLPGVPAYIVQRGHSREPVFFEESDYRAYLTWLGEAARRYDCALHAYVLMTNHVHLLATPGDRHGISQMMQYIGRRYVPYINHTYGTSGSIWPLRRIPALAAFVRPGTSGRALQGLFNPR